MNLRRQARRYGRSVLLIAALGVGALLSIGYVLSQQNLSFPWEDRYTIDAEFATLTGLNPGLGQPVNVAGVRVGTILGVRTRDGRAIATLEIDPHKLPHVFADARAMLIPTTPLKDMQIDVDPGTPGSRILPEDGMIPVVRTTVPIDSDDLTSALDADTREFFQVLLGEGARATHGRGSDLRALFRALGPTAQQAKQVTAVLAQRRVQVRRLVHNVATLSQAVGARDADLTRTLEGAGATVAAFAREQLALGTSLEQLPAVLTAARSTLADATPFALTAASTLTALQPTADRLPATLDAAAPLVRDAGPIIGTRLRPLVRAAQPLARDLGPLTVDLAAVTPSLTEAFRVLTYTVNELAFNPDGDDEGFLYWLAWSAHNANSVLSSADAHGAVARSLVLTDCSTTIAQGALGQLVSLIAGPPPAQCPEP